MLKVTFTCGVLVVLAVSAQDPAAPNVIVVETTASPEAAKLASKDWRNYRGCEDTCLSLCLEKPADYDNKCSTIFSNNTLVSIPASDSCRKFEVIQSCTYQCQCTCKRCGFCKQDLVNACSEDKHPAECFDHVLDNIITNKKCD